MEKQEIEDEYTAEMLKGCICENPNKNVLDKLIKDYETLGGTANELIHNALQKQVLENMIKISSGSLGYPVP